VRWSTASLLPLAATLMLHRLSGFGRKPRNSLPNKRLLVREAMQAAELRAADFFEGDPRREVANQNAERARQASAALVVSVSRIPQGGSGERACRFGAYSPNATPSEKP
jgi:hypothetical protein